MEPPKLANPCVEGLVAMMGPVIDTLIICSATALIILISGVWQVDAAEGVTLTAAGFTQLLGPLGTLVVFVCVLCFATTTVFTYAFYGSQCASFLFGAHRIIHYQWIYITFILVASIISIDAAVNIIDGSFALMAIPTTLSALLLAPKVIHAAKQYWAQLATTRADEKHK